MNFDGDTTPPVHVMPPMTMFDRRTPFSAPYARSSSCAYALGPRVAFGGIGLKESPRVGSPQIIQWRTVL